jgi:uncharacterized phage protein gp47/JayE
MPFNRPSLTQLNERIQGDLNSGIEGADSRLKYSVLGVISRVLAGAFHGLYGYIDYLSKQLLPDSATDEWLRRHAAIWGVAIKAAEPASGLVSLTGVAGSIIPQGTQMQRADGFIFTSQTQAVIGNNGLAEVAVLAQTPSALGVTVAGITLSFVSPVSGVSSQAIVATGGLTGGADSEGDDSLRARLLLRIRSPSYGGSRSDYERWVRELAGVTRVWIYPKWQGEGTIGITCAFDGRSDPIPTTADRANIAAYIDTLRPVTAEVIVFSATPQPINFTIALVPNTPEIRASVIAELTDLFYREATPGGTIPRSRLTQAISNALGETDHNLIAPSGPVVSQPAQLPVLGVITWV